VPTSSAVYVSINARPRRVAPGWQPTVLSLLATGIAAVAASGDLNSPHVTIRLLSGAGTAAFIILSMTAVLRTRGLVEQSDLDVRAQGSGTRWAERFSGTGRW
jgi:hypothetical protein